MAVKIRSFRNIKIIAKKFIKELRILLKKNPYARIGICWDDSLSLIFDEVIKCKKINWLQVSIFTLVEYRDNESFTFENSLYSNFVSKLGLERKNYESLKEKIDELKTQDKLNDLYKLDGPIDIMIFPIDKRGNFLFNDFESKITYINHGNNGNDIICPGIKSIVLAKQIICFAINDGSEKVLEIINSKIIKSDEFVSLLNIHENITLFTLYNIFSKKQINKKGLLSDPNNIIEKVISPSYEGDLINNEKPQDVSAEKVNEISNYTFNDDEDEESDEELDDEKNDNILLSEKDEDVEQISIIDNISDDGKPLDEPLNFDKNNLDNIVEEVVENNFENETEELEKNELLETIENEIKPIEETKEKNELVINEDRELEDKFIDETIPMVTTIGETQIESALFDNSKQNDKLLDKIRELDELKDEEFFVPENYGEIDEELRKLEIVKDQLEKELFQLEEKESSEIKNDVDLLDYDLLEDEVSKEADKYAPKQDTLVIYDDLPNDIEIIDENNNEKEKLEINNFDNNKNKNVINQIENKKINYDYKPFEYINVEGKSKDQIERIIKIKEDTLMSIELLIKNNQLALELEKKKFESKFNTKSINKSNEFKNDYIKIIYNPAMRPVPMLMYYTDANKDSYEQTILEMIDKYKSNLNAKLFNENNNHLWNMSSYFSYNEKTLEIDLLAFSSFPHFVYLLRTLSKPIYFYLDKKSYEIIKDELNEFGDEFLKNH